MAGGASGIVLPAHEAIHSVHADAGGLALIAAFSGLLLAFLIYGLRVVDPADIARQLRGLHGFLVEKWQFDHLYEAMFVRPVLIVSRWFADVRPGGDRRFSARRSRMPRSTFPGWIGGSMKE